MQSESERADETLYSHPPIVDAILEFRLPKENPLKLDVVKKIANALMREGLEKSTDWYEHTAQVESNLANVSSNLIGKELTSGDDKLTVRCLTNAFAFFQHAPYKDWWFFERTAKRFWSTYTAIAQTPPRRIGLRVVNRLPIPFGIDLEQYVTCYPKINSSLPQKWSASVMRVEVPIPPTDYVVGLVQQLTSPSATEQCYDVTLDIDVYCESTGFTEEDIWHRLSEMRKLKNRFFESSITERVREKIR